MTERLLRIEKTAAILDTHPRKVLRMLVSGELPAGVRLGRSWRVDPQRLEQFIHGEQVVPNG